MSSAQSLGRLPSPPVLSPIPKSYHAPSLLDRWVPRTDTFAAGFIYDGKGRLRQITESNWVYGAWTLNATIRYVYDDMRVIQERDANGTPTAAYTRGCDLSGTFEGAGGIGGLLARSSSYSAGSWGAHSMYHADGNGNITYLVSNASAKTGEYRYDPYGRALYTSGSLATANPFRFSSKLWHEKTGFYYYGYRFYDPLTQRLINRDPIGEEGSNLVRDDLESHRSSLAATYVFVAGSPISSIDPFGLSLYDRCKERCKRWWAQDGKDKAKEKFSSIGGAFCSPKSSYWESYRLVEYVRRW